MEEPGAGASNLKFFALICAWYLCTLASNMAGRAFVKGSLDVMSPTTASMGCAAAVYGFRKLVFRKGDGAQAGTVKAMHPSTISKPGEWQGWAFHLWAFGLGSIQFLATALSYSSFALSSVSWTYCFRTLEPLISALLQFLAAGDLTSRRELGALLVLAIGIVTTVTTGSGDQRYAAWLGGLALCATLIYSCRSVIGSRVMKWYKRSGPELFLLASTYGFGCSVWVQFAVNVIGGTVGRSMDLWMLQQLFVAGIFHCIYNLMSFQILQILQPVAHGVCNTMKRVFMVVMSAFVSGHMLCGLQFAGVFIANFGAGVYGYESKRRRELEKNKPHSTSTALDGSNESQPLRENLENGLSSTRIGKDDNARTRSSGSKNEISLTSRLIGFGSIAVIIGVAFLVVSLRALHIQTAGSIGVKSTGKEVYLTAVAIERIKHVVTGVTQKKMLSALPEATESIKENKSSREHCFTDVKQTVEDKFRPIFDQLPEPVIFVDIASHSYGHGTMLLGAMQLAKRFGKQVKTFCTLPDSDIRNKDGPPPFSCDELSNHLEDDRFLVMFGSSSIWGDHNINAQSQRLNFLDSLNATENGLQRPVVQLPNTLSYQGEDISDMELITLGRLKNIHIFVRDAMGVELGKEILPKDVIIEQCPDISFILGALSPAREPTHDILILLQKMDLDSEKKLTQKLSATLGSRNLTWKIVSWGNMMENSESEKISPLSYAEKCVKADIQLLSEGSIIITDDMKAAIMSALLGKPHVVIETERKTVSLAFDALTSVSLNCDPVYLQQTRVGNLNSALKKGIQIAKGSR